MHKSSKVEIIKQSIVTTYLLKQVPWLVMIDQSKESIATASLIYNALKDICRDDKTPTVYFIRKKNRLATNELMANKGSTAFPKNDSVKNTVFEFHSVSTKPENSFLVNLIGRSLSKPTINTKWCVENNEIDPLTTFIAENQINKAAVVLASQKQGENKHSTLHKLDVISFISEWDSKDIYEYLLAHKNDYIVNLYNIKQVINKKRNNTCGSCENNICWLCPFAADDKIAQDLAQSGFTSEQQDILINCRQDILNTNKQITRLNRKNSTKLDLAKSFIENKLNRAIELEDALNRAAKKAHEECESLAFIIKALGSDHPKHNEMVTILHEGVDNAMQLLADARKIREVINSFC